jgi:TonB family protein
MRPFRSLVCAAIVAAAAAVSAPAAAQGATPVSNPAAGEPDVQPVLLTRNLPMLAARAYPERLRAHPVPGSADVHMKILEDGTVDSLSVSVTASTAPEFEGPAMLVAMKLRFRPAQLAGQAVPVWVTFPIHFGPLTDGTSTVTQQDKRMFPYHNARP